jgi:hypothetical protein
MAGKTFNNFSHKDLGVTLFVRQSEDPANNAGQERFDLDSGEGKYVSYGDDANIYLNGITVASVSDGAMQMEREFVVKRGSDLDNQLNMNDTVNIYFPGGGFQIKCSNSDEPKAPPTEE